MKLFFLQILTLGLIVILMGVLELNESNRIVGSTANWTPVNNIYITFFIVLVILSFFCLIFLFEAKKDKSIFQRSFWNMMPKITISFGSLSMILFLVGGTLGPIMTWVEHWRSLLYFFLIYFLFLIFLFIFSIEHKKQRNNHHITKTILTSYIWTIVLFLITFFVF
ncbi:hypothetical protein AMD01_21480 [Priestia koreensis]|uniref:Uncharacterized protein n=1 Tax=Priestia koreensis TaxID=284581 RepID=A0A0M0KND4_9BACI|nr:hypothetical protein AMD01_21480 [Priestia koreensis]